MHPSQPENNAYQTKALPVFVKGKLFLLLRQQIKQKTKQRIGNM